MTLTVYDITWLSHAQSHLEAALRELEAGNEDVAEDLFQVIEGAAITLRMLVDGRLRSQAE